MWWYEMTCFRNLETLSPLQHWVSTESALSVQLRHSWCWQAWFPLSCLGHLWNDDNDVHVSCIQLVDARCTIVFSSRIESNRNQSSHGLWPNSSLWWPMQIYAVCVCVCFSTKETDTYSHHLFRKKQRHQTCKATYIVYACRQKHHANAKKLHCCAWGSHWVDGILGVFNVFVTFVVTSVTYVTFVAFVTFCATLRLARTGSKALVKGHWSLDAHVGLRPVRLSGERSGRGRACFLELPLSGKSSYSMALDGSKWQRRLETPENPRR